MPLPWELSNQKVRVFFLSEAATCYRKTIHIIKDRSNTYSKTSFASQMGNQPWLPMVFCCPTDILPGNGRKIKNNVSPHREGAELE